MPIADMLEGMREQTGTVPLIYAERELSPPSIVSKVTMHSFLSQEEINESKLALELA